MPQKNSTVLSEPKNRNRILFFLQETCSTAEVEDIWRTQSQGKLFFSRGTCHSCGVMVLVRGGLDFNLISIRTAMKVAILY